MCRASDEGARVHDGAVEGGGLGGTREKWPLRIQAIEISLVPLSVYRAQHVRWPSQTKTETSLYIDRVDLFQR